MNQPDAEFRPGESVVEWAKRMQQSSALQEISGVSNIIQKTLENAGTPEIKVERMTTTNDLVTGETILSMPLSSVSENIGKYVMESFERAEAITLNGGTYDISAPVRVCTQQGPFKGFAEIFTPAERSMWQHADAALCCKVFNEFKRLCLGQDVEDIMRKTTQTHQEHLEPLLERIRNPDAQASIAAALSAWNTNRHNPNRNLYYRSRRFVSPENPNPGREYALPMFQQNPHYFSVGKLDSSIVSDNVGAGYDPTMRILFIRLSSGSHDFLDALNSLHESTHVVHHNVALQRPGGTLEENQDRYTNVIGCGKSGNGILEEECEAFANMIEMTFARIGFGTHNIGATLQTLGIPATEEKGRSLYQILQLAGSYYSGGGRKGDSYPPAFVDEIRMLYKRVGAMLFTRNANGFPVPLQ